MCGDSFGGDGVGHSPNPHLSPASTQLPLPLLQVVPGSTSSVTKLIKQLNKLVYVENVQVRFAGGGVGCGGLLLLQGGWQRSGAAVWRACRCGCSNKAFRRWRPCRCIL